MKLYNNQHILTFVKESSLEFIPSESSVRKKPDQSDI